MMLAAAYQSKILVCAKGKEEEQAVDAIVSLFKSNFNEE